MVAVKIDVCSAKPIAKWTEWLGNEGPVPIGAVWLSNGSAAESQKTLALL